MDIFKILSRGTKSTHKPSTAVGAQSSKLPSAGIPTNPQLYHDPVPASRGKKRKLTEWKVEEVTKETEDEEVNFFAPKAENQKKKMGEKDGQKEQEIPKPIPKELKLLDEDECKAILRSHRMKITVLSSHHEAPPPVEEKPKKKKRKSAEEPPKKKDEKKHIFPQPLLSFEDLGTTYNISRRLGENLIKEGYKIPTEVQMGSLPLLLRPKIALTNVENGEKLVPEETEIDLLTVAPTGSGKTLAFLIPVVDSMIQRRRQRDEKEEHPLEAIIVAPTKELANQIVNEGRKLAIGTGIKVVGMQKGMRIVDRDEQFNGDEEAGEDSGSESEQEDEDNDDEKSQATKAKKRLSQPTAKADILVTTPLVLLHALENESRRSPLPTVRHLILDEADVLLDPLFRDQTLGIWNACTNPHLQATLWSATMGSNIESLAQDTITARHTALSLPNPPPLLRLVIGLKDSAIPNITHSLIYTASETGKLLALRQLLHPTSPCLADSTPTLRPPFLVFTQTIPRAIALHSELLYDIPAEAGGSSRLAVLHSDLSDSTRSAIMTRFRNGEIWILITTDILSRGVDFRGINGVVNYDVPNSGAAYIHRVGRTGRAGRDGGIAVTFYTKEDIPYVKGVANIIAASEKAAGKVDGTVKKWLLDALPSVSKKEKKELKLHGVEARRSRVVNDTKRGRGKQLISTKSGFEKRLEHNKKGAVEGSKRRKEAAKADESEGEDFGGFDD
jgi:ATP-dependent RNA helicase DDX52/ROK1